MAGIFDLMKQFWREQEFVPHLEKVMNAVIRAEMKLQHPQQHTSLLEFLMTGGLL